MSQTGGQARDASSELPGNGVDHHEIVDRLLRAVRRHLGLEVAFIGEFVSGRRVFRFVDTDSNAANVISVGDSDALDESYCHYVASGQLPRFLSDPTVHPVSAALPATHTFPVGTHVSVPIRFSDGRVFGTFCCFSTEVRDDVRDDDLRAVELVAELASDYLETLDRAKRGDRERLDLIAEVIADPEAMTLVFQPLRDLETMEIVGVEALARFTGHEKGPAWFFAEAEAAGMGTELEMVAVRLALAELPRIPVPVRLNVNVAAETLYTADFFTAIADVGPDRLVVEVTEHAAIEDYTELKEASARLTELGVCLAIDDVGMGFSGLNRILESSPKELKLDAVVIRDVDASPVKQALVEAFCSFGRRTGFNIVAEGIETQAELQTLRGLGVGIGQGYLLGRPAPLEAVLAELSVGRSNEASQLGDSDRSSRS